MTTQHAGTPGADDAVDDLIDRCHRAAIEAASRTPDVAVADELARTQLELDAISVELERLRQRPEVKLGQLLRVVVQRLRTSARGDAPNAGLAPAERQAAGAGAPPRVDRSGDAPAAVIVVRNRRTALAGLLSTLHEAGVGRIDVVDNATSDPATLELLTELGHPVRRFESPIGADEVWASGLMAQHLAAGPTLLIGGDTVPSDGCPSDVIARMSTELARRTEAEGVAVIGEGVSVDGRRPCLLLVRAGATRRPRVITALPAPYACRIAPADPDDPAERFAAHHDDERLELSEPSTAP